MLACLLGLGMVAPARAQQAAGIFVNGERLPPATIQALEYQYRVRLQPGCYWYDRLSGMWGLEGGPTVGQIFPGLALGGPLRANASGGNTGVFINSRELHQAEVAYLQRCTPVFQGRYWMNAAGIGGLDNSDRRRRIAQGRKTEK